MIEQYQFYAGGLKVVELQGGAARLLAGWMHELGHVAAEAFDVSYYTVTSRRSPAQVVLLMCYSRVANVYLSVAGCRSTAQVVLLPL